MIWEGHRRFIRYHVLPDCHMENTNLLNCHRPFMLSFPVCSGTSSVSIHKIATYGLPWTCLFAIFFHNSLQCSDQTTSWKRWILGHSSWCLDMPQLLLTLSCHLFFHRMSQRCFPTGIFMVCSTDYGKVCPLAQLLLFLLPKIIAHLPLDHLWSGLLHFHCGSRGLTDWFPNMHRQVQGKSLGLCQTHILLSLRNLWMHPDRVVLHNEASHFGDWITEYLLSGKHGGSLLLPQVSMSERNSVGNLRMTWKLTTVKTLRSFNQGLAITHKNCGSFEDQILYFFKSNLEKKVHP